MHTILSNPVACLREILLMLSYANFIGNTFWVPCLVLMGTGGELFLGLCFCREYLINITGNEILVP